MSNDYWIVVKTTQSEFEGEGEARHYRALLARHHPGETFKVVRCKRFPHTAGHFPKLVKLLAEIMEQGVTKDLRDRASVLLATVRIRHEQGPKITRHVPEFEPRRRP